MPWQGSHDNHHMVSRERGLLHVNLGFGDGSSCVSGILPIAATLHCGSIVVIVVLPLTASQFSIHMILDQSWKSTRMQFSNGNSAERLGLQNIDISDTSPTPSSHVFSL